MTYYTGTYTSPANGGQVLSGQMNTWLTANSWTLVDTVTSGTIVSKVYKSPGTSNSFGTDFYLANTYQSTTAGDLTWSMSQAYNTGTHKMTKYAPTTAPGTTPDPTDFTVVDATGLFPYDASLQWGSHYVGAVGFLWTSITVDRVIIGSTYSEATYMGLFDSFLATDPFPIAMTQLTSVSGTAQSFTQGAVTNEPGQVAIDTKNWGVCLAYTSPAYGALSPSQDIYNGGKYLAQRTYFGCNRGWATYGTGQPIGYRGLPKDVLLVAGGSVSAGDTMVLTIGVTNYTYTMLRQGTFSPSSYYVWMLQA